MSRLLSLLLVVLPLVARCQEMVYVNTDNLILRDRPGNNYIVMAILHAPCRLEVEPYQSSYKDDKKITSRFYQVGIRYTEGEITHYYSGFVDKRYVIADPARVHARGNDTALDISISIVPLARLPGWVPEEDDPEHANALRFLPPKYKGGERFPAAKTIVRTYYRGTRGGCYYLGKNGQKVYVNQHLCNGN